MAAFEDIPTNLILWIFLLQEMARVHYAKMGPKMQSIKSEPGESHVAQSHGCFKFFMVSKKTSTNPPGRRTQAMRDGALEHPVAHWNQR